MNSPNGVRLVSRIIVTPSRMKRVTDVLKDHLDKYEKQFGSIKEPAAAGHTSH